ncbi:MAG: lipid II flippase MurJ [Patescibacteria group bacterium]
MNQIFSRTTKRISLGGAASLLFAVTLITQLLGFLRNRLISTNFTVNDPGSSDAFFAAFQLPDFFFYTITAGALGVTFIPFLVDRMQASDRKGVWELTSSLLNILAIVMAGVSVLTFIFAKPMIHLLAPNLPADHLAEAVRIMQFISFNPLLFTLSGILTSVQQTFGRFFFYALAPLMYNAMIIVSIFIFRDSLGIVGLGVGALIGAIVQLGVAAIGMYGLGFRYWPIIKWKNQNFRGMLRNLPARSLDQGVDQVNSIAEVNRAQALGTGPVSYYNFALTLHNVPIFLLGNSIAIAAFPRLTERLSQNRSDLFRKEFLDILRAMIWITVPVVIVSYFARGYLARLIFGDVAPDVARIFEFLAFAIFFRILYTMLSRYFYAHKDTKTPLVVSIFAIALNIFLAFTLAKPQTWNISGLALAQLIVAIFEVTVLFLVIVWRSPRFFNSTFWRGLVRVSAASGFSLIATFIMISLLPLQIADRGLVTLGTKFGLISLITLIVHLGASYIFGLSEAKAVMLKVRNIILKPIRQPF